MEEAITTSADQVNVRTPRESRGKSDTEVPVLWHQKERDAPKMHGTIGAAAERTEDHNRRLGGANTKREPPTKTPRVHDVQSILKMGLGFSKEDQVVRVKLAHVTERVRVHKADTRDGSTERGGKAVHQQIEQER